jgi:hypothetical protein
MGFVGGGILMDVEQGKGEFVTNAKAGWYPNPENPNEMQYFDGTAWTGTFQRYNGSAWVAHPAPGSPPPQKKSGRLGLTIGLVAGGLVALIVGLVVAVNVVVGAGDASSLSSRSIVRTDERAGYDYTEPVRDLEDRTLNFLFKTNFDPYDVPAWVAEEGGSEDGWAVRVFANPELTVEVPTSVYSSYINGTGFGISSSETRYAIPFDLYQNTPTVIRSTYVVDADGNPDVEYVDVDSLSQGAYSHGGWGLYDSYYLVRYIDADGAKLDRPVVSEFAFSQELSTPSATIVADDTTAGAAKFVWGEVAGADHYVVVKSFVDGSALEVWDGQLVSRDYVAIAETSQTSWSTSSQEFTRFGDPVGVSGEPYLTTQNEALEMFSVSADEFVGDPLGRPLGHAQVEYGVIAVAADGTTSAFGRASVASDVSSLPYEIAVETLKSIGACDGGYYKSECGSADQVLTYVPYIGLDGDVRVTPAHMNEDPWKVYDGSRYIAALVGEGTDIGYWAAFTASSVEDFRAKAAAFNERSRLAAPQTGLVETQLAGLRTVAEPTSEYSDASFARANGTNELVTYIAAHMIDGHEAIDMSQWGDWSDSDMRDAVDEAYWQNPIAGVEGYDYRGNESIVVVAYEDDRDARMAQTDTAIDRIIDTVIMSGMTDSEKVTAINSYIVDNVEYDYDALDSVMFSYVPERYQYAWTLSGALLGGSVVCVGYSQAFKALSDAAGLESVIVTGAVVDSAVGHAWNKVNVDGEWFVVDSTWNDGPDRSKYLLISDSFFTGDSAREYDNSWVFDLYARTYATN